MMLRLCCSVFSVVLISRCLPMNCQSGSWVQVAKKFGDVLPMNCQSGSWVQVAKKFGDVFVGSFVESGQFSHRESDSKFRRVAPLCASPAAGGGYLDKASDKVSDKDFPEFLPAVLP
jgi:hypothetical protein